jgi:hypothetical protein
MKPSADAPRSVIYEFKLWQDGVMVASATGVYFDEVLAEAQHYFAQYAQDGCDSMKLVIGPKKGIVRYDRAEKGKK